MTPEYLSHDGHTIVLRVKRGGGLVCGPCEDAGTTRTLEELGDALAGAAEAALRWPQDQLDTWETAEADVMEAVRAWRERRAQ